MIHAMHENQHLKSKAELSQLEKSVYRIIGDTNEKKIARLFDLK